MEWEFFEHYNGMVYVTEMDTHRLVYMNARLRRALGVKEGEYQGQLCHQVLQGREYPCEFCTNGKLEEGNFRSWTYRNSRLEVDLLLNDTRIRRGGREYRLEIATEVNMEGDALYYIRNEQILGDCLQQMFSAVDENQAMDTLLQYIGETFSCERVYVFELAEHNRVNNTYEWCAQGVTAQKECLQNVPYESVGFWFDLFDQEGIFSIGDLEDIRDSHPLTYAYLRTQDVQSLLVGPIRRDERYIGFIGADNPKKESLPALSALIRVIGYFVSVLLRRRDLTNQLRIQGQRDTLTGAWNRNALVEFLDQTRQAQSLGLVYCDISGLKQVNDRYGHDAGDKLILQSYRLISSTMEPGNTYRIGGDEFVTVCLNLSREEFAAQVERLRQSVAGEEYHIAVGSTWTDLFPTSFDALLKQADQEMYRDKEEYYSRVATAERRNSLRRRGAQQPPEPPIPDRSELEHKFPAWMGQDTTTCVCAGDIRSNYYYLSKGMRKKFGFPTMIVQDFLDLWEKRIIGTAQKQLFRREIQEVLAEKRTTVDVSYTMQDSAGEAVLVRSVGVIEWDDTYTAPVTFIGNAHVEPTTVVADPVTGLPTLHSAAETLGSLEEDATVLLFKLNHFGKVNESVGREAGNRLLKQLAEQLHAHFQGAASFFRLDGMKFMGVLRTGSHRHQAFMQEIRESVDRKYQEERLTMADAVTFLPVDYANRQEHPLELIKNISELMSVAQLRPASPAIANSEFYLHDMREGMDIEVALLRDVRNQMSNFRIQVQPMVGAATGEIVGGEVLLCWTFQDRDVPPKIFLPILEREKLMGTVGRWALDQTAQCCRNLSVYRPDLFLSLDVRGWQLVSGEFAEGMRRVLEKYGVPGERLVVELTETHEEEAPAVLKSFLDACRGLGVRVVLDNFGNGEAGLSLLLKQSAQIVKLDPSMLREMVTSGERRRLVHGLVESCHMVDKQVCVEGVETEAELAVAARTGCDLIQGPYFHGPLELSQLYRVLVTTG